MKGIHHLGLSVSNLEATRSFFCETLGWQEVRRLPEYPAVFVFNGFVTFTLWQTASPSQAFDRKHNVGLHHVALAVESEEELIATYHAILSAGVSIEFAPEYLRDGPAKHMMCVEASGIRVEFIWTP